MKTLGNFFVSDGAQDSIYSKQCKLLYMESTDNKVLLYSTENYIQYLVITYIIIYLSESLCCTPETNTTM